MRRSSELLVRVDPGDHVLGAVEREQAHVGDGVLHRGLLVVVKDRKNRVYITKRSEVRPDLGFPPPFPLFWDISIAGHPRWGQRGYVVQMLREVEEELNIDARAEQLQWLGRFRYKAADPTYPNDRTSPDFRITESEICGIALLHTIEDPDPNPVEIERGEWIEAEMLKSVVTYRQSEFTPWCVDALRRFPQVIASEATSRQNH